MMQAKLFDDGSTNRYLSIVGAVDTYTLGATSHSYSSTRAFLTKLNLDDTLQDGDCSSPTSFTLSTTAIGTPYTIVDNLIPVGSYSISATSITNLVSYVDSSFYVPASNPCSVEVKSSTVTPPDIDYEIGSSTLISQNYLFYDIYEGGQLC
jgi:hypothetical protein